MASHHERHDLSAMTEPYQAAVANEYKKVTAKFPFVQVAHMSREMKFQR